MMNKPTGCYQGLCEVHGIYEPWSFFTPKYALMALELLCPKAILGLFAFILSKPILDLHSCPFSTRSSPEKKGLHLQKLLYDCSG